MRTTQLPHDMITDRESISALQCLRLLQLASPSLPVGSYAYSQGMEMAVESGWINDVITLEAWLQGLLGSTLTRVDLPLLQRLHMAWQQQDVERVGYWNDYLLASRETMELRNEEQIRGKAIWNLLHGTGCVDSQMYASMNADRISFVCGYACAIHQSGIDLREAALAYVWSWAENQVLAAIKLMPVGQLAGQNLLGKLMPHMTAAVEHGLCINDDGIGAMLPASTLASVLHETQYSRLFRS